MFLFSFLMVRTRNWRFSEFVSVQGNIVGVGRWSIHLLILFNWNFIIIDSFPPSPAAGKRHSTLSFCEYDYFRISAGSPSPRLTLHVYVCLVVDFFLFFLFSFFLCGWGQSAHIVPSKLLWSVELPFGFFPSLKRKETCTKLPSLVRLWMF